MLDIKLPAGAKERAVEAVDDRASVPLESSNPPGGPSTTDCLGRDLEMRNPARTRVEVCLLFAILLFSAGIYLGSLPRDFTNWDDPEYIVNNPLIRSFDPSNLNKIISEPYFANYAPLTLLSYALDYKLWELNPLGYHLHNLLLHLGCILALYFLLRALNLSRSIRLIVVLLFATHPVNVESVAWASERKNLLASLFFLLSFHGYIRYRDSLDRVHYLSAILFFLLSLLSKASTVVAPLVFLAYDYFKSGHRLRSLSLYDKLPFIILAEIHTFLSIHAAGTRNALNSYHHGGPWLSAFASGRLFQEYVGLLFWPINLSAMYYPRESPTLGNPLYWMPLLLLIGLALLLYRISNSLFFWLSFSAILLVPVMNIVPLPIMMANRYLYLPQIGVWVITASLFEYLWLKSERHRSFRCLMAAMIALWTALLGTEAWNFSQSWKTTETLWSDVIDKDFMNEIAHYNLGLSCVSRGLVNRAGLEFGIALGINPNYHLAQSGMGGYYFEKGQTEAAKRKFLAAINSSPDFDIAMNNLGKVYAETGDWGRALFMFYRAIYANPKNIGALNNIVVLYLKVNKPEAAREVALGMIQTYPDAPDGFFRLGMCLEAEEKFQEAMKALETGRNLSKKDQGLWKQIDSRLASVRAKLSTKSL